MSIDLLQWNNSPLVFLNIPVNPPHLYTCWRWSQVLLEAGGLPEGAWDKKNTERDQRQSGETQRANVEVTADRMGARGAQESGVREIKQPETLRHREKSAMWTWVLVWKPHLFILVIGALILLNVWYNQPFQSCF